MIRYLGMRKNARKAHRMIAGSRVLVVDIHVPLITAPFSVSAPYGAGGASPRSLYCVVPHHVQTKSWRQLQPWYSSGKHSECERYQFAVLSAYCGVCLEKRRGLRLNVESAEMRVILHPNKANELLQWTEDFDGEVRVGSRQFLFNLKFVCGSGGAQTRSMREVYHFIKAQTRFAKDNVNGVAFVNILEGDGVGPFMVELKELASPRVFVGDMVDFQAWWFSKVATSFQ